MKRTAGLGGTDEKIIDDQGRVEAGKRVGWASGKYVVNTTLMRRKS